MSKVVIIGCGNVGMSYAYSLLNQLLPIELLNIRMQLDIAEK